MSSPTKFTNHLIKETSPYLLQHAHNPVDWYPWGDVALQLAKQSNKPILVSIGYSACHWCHVMERESFEDEDTAAIMNEHFVNIKIDREERPDLDHIYMDAVQAMTGSGGWPLNVFLTPEGKPFYGGTYFPPRPAFNRASWQDTLQSVSEAFNMRRHEVDAQAENLTAHLLQANAFGLQQSSEDIFADLNIQTIAQNMLSNADTEWGGFGKAPKFPQTFSIQFLLRNFHVSGNEPGLKQGLLSLDKMIDGGIYDQLRGGFARYSTDTEWLAPHFEKMLYDNALLLGVICEAFQLTGKKRYVEVINETMEFIQAELLFRENEHEIGFYAALDADSEGVEGKFYVWTYEEIQQLLGSDAQVFSEYYDISTHGNWEHTNILRVKIPLAAFAAQKQLDEAELQQTLDRCRGILLQERAKRIRPGLDDKIILGWNALMNSACSKVFSVTGNEEYKKMATANMQFLLNRFRSGSDQSLHHTWKNGQAKYPAFLDDYAYLIRALIDLQEITGDAAWLIRAKDLTSYVTDHFSEADTGYFFYTADYQQDVIVRKKEVYDGAVPSGNAVMAYNLYHLSILAELSEESREWGERSRQMVESLGKVIIKYPTSFGVWASLLQELIVGTNEVVIAGPGFEKLHQEVLREYIPHRVLMAALEGSAGFPLLQGKSATKPSIFLCRNYTCVSPVFSAKELRTLINSGRRAN